MDVVRGGHVVEDRQTVAFFGFKQPAYPGHSVCPKFEEELFPM
jgi:hypothetical protein